MSKFRTLNEQKIVICGDMFQAVRQCVQAISVHEGTTTFHSVLHWIGAVCFNVHLPVLGIKVAS